MRYIYKMRCFAKTRKTVCWETPFAGFGAQLALALAHVLLSSDEDEVSAGVCGGDKEDEKDSAKRRRGALRLLLELHLNGVHRDEQLLLRLLRVSVGAGARAQRPSTLFRVVFFVRVGRRRKKETRCGERGTTVTCFGWAFSL